MVFINATMYFFQSVFRSLLTNSYSNAGIFDAFLFLFLVRVVDTKTTTVPRWGAVTTGMLPEFFVAVSLDHSYLVSCLDSDLHYQRTSLPDCFIGAQMYPSIFRSSLFLGSSCSSN